MIWNYWSIKCLNIAKKLKICFNINNISIYILMDIKEKNNIEENQSKDTWEDLWEEILSHVDNYKDKVELYLSMLFMRWKIKNINAILYFYDIKTRNDFDKLKDKVDYIRIEDLIQKGKADSLCKILNICENQNDFEMLLNNKLSKIMVSPEWSWKEYLFWMLVKSWKSSSLKIVFDIYEISWVDELIELMESDNFDILSKIAIDWDVKVLSEILRICNINSKTSFEELLNSHIFPNVIYLIKHWKIKNFRRVLELYKLETKDDLEIFFADINSHHILKIIVNWRLKDVDYIFEVLNSNEKNKKDEIWNLIEFNTKETLKICWRNEKFNKQILKGGKPYFAFLKFDWEVIWHIKWDKTKIWEETFLSYQTIFDSNGRLCFIKWGIYYIDDFERLLNEDYRESNIEEVWPLNMNFLRMSKLKNFDKMVNKFLEEKLD